jgi:hypothetical protein
MIRFSRGSTDFFDLPSPMSTSRFLLQPSSPRIKENVNKENLSNPLPQASAQRFPSASDVSLRISASEIDARKKFRRSRPLGEKDKFQDLHLN